MSDDPSLSGKSGPADAPGDVRSEAEQRDFEIRFYEGVLKCSPTFIEVLQVLGGHYTAVGRYADGLTIDRRLVRLSPDDPIAHYNLACSLSLTGKAEAALRELAEAVHLGYDDVDHMEQDPDLENLRDEPVYAQLVQRLRGL